MTIYSGFSHWKLWFSIVMLVYQSVSQIPFLPGLRFSKALLGRVGVYLFGKSMKYDLRWTLQDWLSTIDLLIYLDDLGCTSRLVISLTCHHESQWDLHPLPQHDHMGLRTLDGANPFATWYSEIDFVATAHRQIATKPPWHAVARQAGSTLCTVTAPYTEIEMSSWRTVGMFVTFTLCLSLEHWINRSSRFACNPIQFSDCRPGCNLWSLKQWHETDPTNE